MILFNTGSRRKELPQFKLNGQDFPYTSGVKFLGVYLTTKLNWKRHLETILSKERKGFNLLKIIRQNTWDQGTKTPIHLAKKG